MLVGVPKEIKNNENRVAITPAGVEAMIQHGHKVFIEKNAGVGSGILDDDYQAVGAEILKTAPEVFDTADMIIKVKEPLEKEFALLKKGQLLFTYLHLAPAKELTLALLKTGIKGVAYETVQTPNGTLPLLIPMSEIAGRLVVQTGAHFLEKPHGGRGVLLGGVPGVPAGNVVIIGGGIVGTPAAKMAVGLGGHVTIIDISAKRLAQLDDLFGPRVQTLMSNNYNITAAVRQADLLIGGVLIPGGRAPHLVTEKMVESMNHGAVIVDVAIDQGGCIETIDRATTHSDPVYTKHGVIHYSVANMPALVARTSTFALTNVTLPYALDLADKGMEKAVQDDPALALGVNVYLGKCTYKHVADDLDLEYTPLEKVLE